MAKITVTKLSEDQLMKFRVLVEEKDSQTEHSVSLNRADYFRITSGKAAPEKLIQQSFEYLLEQEPKESILASFDFNVIGQYFPKFPKEISTRIREVK